MESPAPAEEPTQEVKPAVQPYVPYGDTLKVEVIAVDMLEDLQKEVILAAQDAMSRYTVEKDIAQHIKRNMDEHWGTTWHCIVGSKFGSFVTHESRHFIYFYLGHAAILLFKTH